MVLGVLATLVALLAPAMARSGDNRARTVCFNNLRQMGVALNLYTAEHQDTLPWPIGALTIFRARPGGFFTESLIPGL